MIVALLTVLRALRSAWLVELAGAVLIVVGVYLAWGVAAAFIGGGAVLVLKAFELESAQ